MNDMGSVGFNKAKLNDLASQTNNLYRIIKDSDDTLSYNISRIMDYNNWSGPIRDSAEVELMEIKNAWPQLVESFGELNTILTKTSNNFDQISYNSPFSK